MPAVTIPARAGSSVRPLSDPDNSRLEVVGLLELAGDLKAEKLAGIENPRLARKNLVMASDSPSSRTLSAFATAAREQGASFSFLDHDLDGAVLADAERSTGRSVDGIAIRTREQAALDLIAADATIPVWNAKTELWHPTHALADLLTIAEHSLTPIADVTLSIVGNARSSVVQSILATGALLGIDIRVAAPDALRPDRAILDIAERNAMAAAEALGRPIARILVTDDLDDAVAGADFLYASPWVHADNAPKLWRERTATMRRFRVDESVVAKTGNSQLKLLHNLPGARDRASALGRSIFTEYALLGADVADGVLRSSRSRVAAQIENRVHVVKAVMANSFR
jgi:ornithine carbamoyltransferase